MDSAPALFTTPIRIAAVVIEIVSRMILLVPPEHIIPSYQTSRAHSIRAFSNDVKKMANRIETGAGPV